MRDKTNNDEIDLLYLFLKAVRVFNANFWTIILFFLVGSAVGVAYFFSTRKVFENKMIISSDILTKPYSTILFENANTHLAEGNFELIATQFKISESAARQIRSLTIASLTKVEADEKESGRFLITAEVYDQQILPDLQRGLIEYFENNEFVKIRVEQSRSYLKQMLASTEKEIKDMEDFKARIFAGDFFQNAKGNVMFDPTTVNSKILDLTEKKINYQNSLQLSSSVQIIEGFTRFEKPSNPKLSVSVAAGSFVGLFFVAVFIAIKSIKKVLQMADSKPA